VIRLCLCLLLSGCCVHVQRMECDYANERRQQPSLVEPLPDGGILVNEPVEPQKRPVKPKSKVYG